MSSRKLVGLFAVVVLALIPKTSVVASNAERLTLRPDTEDAWLLEGAIYEVDLKYFENHHYDDLVAQLPRLKELGVKVIYLLPVFESAGHGEYNIYDYYKLDPYFGTAEDLKNLVKKAHAHGIKMLLDLVTSITPEGSKVYEHQDWLLRGDDGKIQRYYPFPDWGWAPDPTHPEVIDYFAKVTSHYVKEFDIDGWRIDSPTDHFDPRKVSGDHSRVKLLRAAKAACVSIKPGAIFVAESPSPDQSFFPISRDANPAFDEMCEASYSYPFCEFLAGTEESGFRLDMIPGYAGKEKEIEETFFYRVVEGKVSSKEFAAAVNRQKVLFDAYRANFLETHDTGRIAERYPKQHPALFAMVATMPGVPVIHAGQEIGATTPSAHAGTDARPVIDWAKGDKEVEAVYRRLMRLRSESKAIQYGVLENAWFAGDPILAYTRRYEDDLVLVVLHFGAETAEATVAVTAGGFASSLTLADCIAGTDLKTGADGNLKLRLPPYGWRVYRARASAG